MDRQRTFLLTAILLFTILAGLMLTPFMGYILIAVILGFILHPAQKRLQNHVSPSIAAGVLIVATVLAAVLPALISVGFIAGDAAALAQTIDQQPITGLQELEQYIEGVIGQDIDLRERVKSAARSAASYVAGSASKIVQVAASVGIGISIMLFIQFYTLRDGARFIAWTKQFDVMPTDLQEQLYENTANTTRSVIKGHAFVAILQGTLAGIGLFFVGIPNVVFWTFLMVLLGFIPMVGAAFVWVPAVIYLVLTGSVVPAVLLLIYSVVVMVTTDNIARPLLVDEEANIHEVFILVGIVGGVYLFGAVGIFLGPILFGVLKNLLEIYRDSYDTL